MSGYGDTGQHGGPPGDLYVFVRVESHPLFSREGDDLYLDLPISTASAALGLKKDNILIRDGSWQGNNCFV